MDPFGAAGILIYCVTLLPVSGLVHVGGQVVADRYSYLPTVGILLTVSGIVLGNGVRIRRALCWAIGAAIPAMLVTTSFQIDHWRNSETLWRRALKFNPENPIARNNLGMFFLDKGSFRSAEREFRYAIACAPGEIRPHINLGDTLLRLKDFSGAEAAYRTGLSVNPRHALCRQGLGLALLEQGDWEHAAKHLKLALAGDNRLGYAYYGLSRIATTRKPDGPNATAEARIYAANACQLTRYQDPRLLAHYARTIARDGDFELAYKVGLAALRQIAGMKESEIGKDIEEVLDTCRSRRVAQPVAEGAKLNGQQFWETGSE